MSERELSTDVDEDRALHFPPGFLWGAATSPTQVEGKTCNEWRSFVARDGSTCDGTSTHWTQWQRDFALLSELGLGAYRMGLDWARLQPAPLAALDTEVLAQYRTMIEALTHDGIEPIITLFHFASPTWLSEAGGWEHPQSIEYFADFVRRVSDARLPVRYWITFNEPGVYMTMAYLIGLFPPHRRFSFLQAGRVLEHQGLAHKLARRILRDGNPEAQVGFTKHFKRFLPYRPWHPLDEINVRIIRTFFDDRVLAAFMEDGGRAGCDFLGVNYYGRMRVKGFGDVSPVSGAPAALFEQFGTSCDDMWEQDPHWFPTLLQRLGKTYCVPMIITESGFATSDDGLRQRLLDEHLLALHHAIDAGCDVRGFIYWSLFDNFEWAEGVSKRFGLAAVDFSAPDMPRSIRSSGYHYGAIARANAIHPR